eukprot:m.45072 g.45072  ORF g.45072 m.45072 type:complete len:331 (-) comp14627_c0_seq1:27-1019(-)
MAEDEYESLPEHSGPLVHMSAGAAAGMFEHTVMFPFDVVKTRLQRLAPPPGARYKGLRDAFRTMIQQEGTASLFSGIRAVALGAGPAHALYFGTYEQAKLLLGANVGSAHHPFATALSGVSATVAHDAFMNPVEVVKQRLQVHSSPYTGVMHCVRSVLKEEGVSAFYRSYSTQLVMNIPYQCTHLVIYEFLRKTLNPDGTYHPPTHLVAGAGAGAIAAAVTTPFDVAKTLLNTQEQCPGFSAAQAMLLQQQQQQAHVPGRKVTKGIVNAMKTIYTTSGYAGFIKGISARVLFTAPATAISWSVYEFFKHYLSFVEGDAEEMATKTGASSS